MEILLYIVIGFVAQIVDGTIGMFYGIICRIFLRITIGVPTSIASAVVHIAELPTACFSGVAHMRFRNVKPHLLFPLIVTGMLGGILGAYYVVNISNILEPLISVYLLIIGMAIFMKAFQEEQKVRHIGKKIYLLGLVGGFLDSVGGGGWGPIVGSTLIRLDDNIKKNIGTVNIAEFFIVLAETVTFIAIIGNLDKYVDMIIGLIVGGVIAAPISALLCNRLSSKKLLILVALLLMIFSMYELCKK